jgi:hypothetical protein
MSPAGSCYYQQGLASGLRQRQGCLYPLPFWTLSPAESKVKSDLPQLPIGGGESGLLRKRSGLAAEMQAVRETVFWAAAKATRSRRAAPKEMVCMILNCLVEGDSACATARLCDVGMPTVL